MINVGDKAPDFTLADQDGTERRFSEFKGKKIILAFYPFDFSPVCTTEFNCFQDDLSEFSGLDVQIIGISVDSKYSHKEFANKHHIKFPLLSDFNREVCRQYGTLREEGFSNRAYFLIDRSGIVRFKHVMPAPKDRLENSHLFVELKKI